MEAGVRSRKNKAEKKKKPIEGFIADAAAADNTPIGSQDSWVPIPAPVPNYYLLS